VQGHHCGGEQQQAGAVSTSPKPYLLTRRIKADDVPTMVCVRNPATLPWMVRSRPMIAVSPNAANSSTRCRPLCTGPPNSGSASHICMPQSYLPGSCHDARVSAPI
jgi:hypothetical protein